MDYLEIIKDIVSFIHFLKVSNSLYINSFTNLFKYSEGLFNIKINTEPKEDTYIAGGEYLDNLSKQLNGIVFIYF